MLLHHADMPTIIELDETVKEDASHGDGVTREIWVVVHTITDLEACGRVGVTRQQCEDVVLWLS